MDRRGLPRNETQVNLQGLGLDTSAIPSPLMYGGFVDVTQPEPPRISTLRRIKSTSTFMETQEGTAFAPDKNRLMFPLSLPKIQPSNSDSVKFTYRQVENKINSLQRELLELRNRLDAFEEDHRKPKWAVKYSRMYFINLFLLILAIHQLTRACDLLRSSSSLLKPWISTFHLLDTFFETSTKQKDKTSPEYGSSTTQICGYF